MKDALNEIRSSGIQVAGTEVIGVGSGKDLGPTALVKAVLNVTVVESGATIALNVQGSADDGDTYVDLPGGEFLNSSGAAIAAVGRYEIFIKTALRYIGYSSVVATDDVTWELYLTKAHK